MSLKTNASHAFTVTISTKLGIIHENSPFYDIFL